jgi:hypothetical protein
MGLRFKRSFKLMPGVRMHLSGSGVSTSIGPRGASINIGPKGATASVGIPGTGLSYRSKLSTLEAVAPPTTIAATNKIGSPGAGPAYECSPEEAVYRISALLAAALLAGADHEAVHQRLVGLLPEKFGSLTCVQLSVLLIGTALGYDGTSYKGTAAIRRALTKCGLRGEALVPDAVAAVRASLKARSGDEVDTSAPVEWYRIGDLLLSREFEAPSLRARIPEASLVEFHRLQLELGSQRLADPNLVFPRRQVSVVWWAAAATVVIASLVTATLLVMS